MNLFWKHFPEVEKALSKNPKIKDQRVVMNHAIILAAAKPLQTLIPDFTDQLFSELAQFANKRAENRSSRIGNDHPTVEQFWSDFNLINEPSNHMVNRSESFNHSQDHTLIALNLEEVHQEFKRKFIETAPKLELKKLLKQSISRPFIEIKTIRSGLTQKATHCWLFKKSSHDIREAKSNA
jgi:hypothetical protein